MTRVTRHVCPECGDVRPEAGTCPQDGSELVSNLTDRWLGAQVGSYRLAKLLGAGGLGQVYLGVQPTIGSRVAVKMLSREYAQRGDLVQRFFAEARAVNLIRHEGIVNVLDLIFISDGLPVIIMEYLDGEPLSAIFSRSGPLALGNLTDVAIQILDALDASHQKGIVHRDLKPANIIVTRGGRAKVLDFGVAKLRPEPGGTGMQTIGGIIMGTPHYMAPEQARGAAVDPRSDLYALGVILFEGATGRKPFPSDEVLDILQHHLHTPPPSPREIRAELPPLYDRLILRALAKDPGQRFQSAKEMSRALREASVGCATSRTMLSGVSTAILPGPGPAPEELKIPPAAAHTPSGPITTRAKRSDFLRPSGWLVWMAIVCILSGLSGILLRDLTTTKPPSGSQLPPQSSPPAVPTITSSVPATSPTTSVASEPSASIPVSSSSVPPEPPPTAAQPPTAPVALQPIDSTPPPSPAPPTPFWLDVPYTERLPSFKVERDYDPALLDPLSYIPQARAHAQRMAEDVEWVSLTAEGVRPDGRVDLTFSPELDVSYWFLSAHRSRLRPDAPVGLDEDRYCLVWVRLTRDEILVANTTSLGECNHRSLTPHCSLQEVWDRARRRVELPSNAVARITYPTLDGKWFFTVGDETAESVDDKCK